MLDTDSLLLICAKMITFAYIAFSAFFAYPMYDIQMIFKTGLHPNYESYEYIAKYFSPLMNQDEGFGKFLRVIVGIINTANIPICIYALYSILMFGNDATQDILSGLLISRIVTNGIIFSYDLFNILLVYFYFHNLLYHTLFLVQKNAMYIFFIT